MNTALNPDRINQGMATCPTCGQTLPAFEYKGEWRMRQHGTCPGGVPALDTVAPDPVRLYPAMVVNSFEGLSHRKLGPDGQPWPVEAALPSTVFFAIAKHRKERSHRDGGFYLVDERYNGGEYLYDVTYLGPGPQERVFEAFVAPASEPC